MLNQKEKQLIKFSVQLKQLSDMYVHYAYKHLDSMLESLNLLKQSSQNLVIEVIGKDGVNEANQNVSRDRINQNHVYRYLLEIQTLLFHLTRKNYREPDTEFNDNLIKLLTTAIEFSEKLKYKISVR